MGVFVFSEKPLLTSYACASQTTRRRIDMQTACFLEDISLKKCLQTSALPFTHADMVQCLPNSSNIFQPSLHPSPPNLKTQTITNKTTKQ
ncbi:hypothetical protein HanPI659440_Chr13g0496031 [Helianthus annuus]|nr:hypothetical protein HanPI659440_Chr13g0496031 [Helianthus annuus]